MKKGDTVAVLGSGPIGLTGPLTIPDGVKGIGTGAFLSCLGLTGTLTIPKSVKKIGDRAFYHCRDLTLQYTFRFEM